MNQQVIRSLTLPAIFFYTSLSSTLLSVLPLPSLFNKRLTSTNKRHSNHLSNAITTGQDVLRTWSLVRYSRLPRGQIRRQASRPLPQLSPPLLLENWISLWRNVWLRCRSCRLLQASSDQGRWSKVRQSGKNKLFCRVSSLHLRLLRMTSEKSCYFGHLTRLFACLPFRSSCLIVTLLPHLS
jgi:hypothetical protein